MEYTFTIESLMMRIKQSRIPVYIVITICGLSDFILCYMWGIDGAPTKFDDSLKEKKNYHKNSI